jgi:cyanophycinase-like exopeptidase
MSALTTRRHPDEGRMSCAAIALHGGGEFLPGDEAFLRACLEAGRPVALARAAAGNPSPAGDPSPAGVPARAGDPSGGDPAAIRVAIVPAAAADQRPDLAARHGVDAFARVAAAAGIAARAEAVMVVDAASAASASLARRLAGADLVHLPGGDPGRLLDILDGSAAWHAILAAVARGAVLAGASAGAMVLAAWTWTPGGWRRGLGLVPGLVVVPHAERVARTGWAGTFGARVPVQAEPIGRLGLDERTAILSEVGPDGGRRWRVIGTGSAHWSPDDGVPPIHATAGKLLTLPA